MSSHLVDNPLVRRSDVPRLLLIGVDHRSAGIELREKVAYGRDRSMALMGRLTAAAEIAEAFILTTCNRTELYLLPTDDPAAYRLGLRHGFTENAPEIEAEGRFYVKRGREAARHLLEVASGLRSMVLGEPEILGQVKTAACQAAQAGASGPVLRRLLRSAIGAGKRARNETAIGAGSVSFGYAVVGLAQSLFERVEGRSVLLVGAGETARQVARNLRQRGCGRMTVSNRSRERLEAFRSLFPEVRTLPFDRLPRALASHDVVVVSTAAGGHVLRQADFAAALRSRAAPDGAAMLVVDLGVPRNVEPSAGQLANLHLHDVDSLEDLIVRNLNLRRGEAPRVEEILDRELARFADWYRGRVAEPLVADLQRRAEQLRRAEVEGARGRFPAHTHEHLDRLTRSLVRKLLHHPSVQMRSAAAFDSHKLELVRELFRLGDDDG